MDGDIVKTGSGEQENKSLAMELLDELKTQNKRLIRVLWLVLLLWAATIGSFILYINQYEYATYNIDSQDGGNASFIGNDGDIYNGEYPGKNENKEKQ